jgi:ribulose-5-phosphate 4-epimerase/fuculose-1-phosphate aldolase
MAQLKTATHIDEQLVEKLADAYETLGALDLFDYAGDVSVRVTDRTYLIRAARASFAALGHGSRVRTTSAEILLADVDGRVVSGSGELPIEAITHGTIFAARPRINSVLHCHPKMATVLSMAGVVLRPVFVRGVEVIGDGLPIYPDSDPITTRAQAENVLNALGDARACVLPAHGVIVVGETLEQACMGVVNLEQSATAQFLASLVGTPSELSHSSIRKRMEINEHPDFFASTWAYYSEHAKKTRA